MMEWIKTSEEKPPEEGEYAIDISDDGINVSETALYTNNRHCMLAGIGGGNGYFGDYGFATDGSQCDRGLILDDPEY